MVCQRCHESLNEADRYCSACGLPQLIYVASETSSMPRDGADSQPHLPLDGNPLVVAGTARQIAWRPALVAASQLAIPAAFLCSGRVIPGVDLGAVWMVAAAAWAVGLYARRSRAPLLTTGAGARIGLVTGLLTCWLLVCVDGLWLWVARFGMHQGTQMDADWTAKVENSLVLIQKTVSDMGLSGAEATQIVQFDRAWMTSAEGQAGLVLTDSLWTVALLLCFGMLGGALGARLLVQRGRRGV